MMTRVGILVECGPQGLEVVVCKKICELLNAQDDVNFEPTIVPMDNKRRLIEECGTATANLFSEGCQRVVILWDERPAWPTAGDRLCWHNDRQDILAELEKSSIANQPVYLICIEREFESWLLYDHVMLSEVLSRLTHPVRVSRQNNPNRIANPKGRLNSIYEEKGGRRYVDRVEGRRIANALSELTRLRRCSTFERFAAKVTGR